MSNEEQSSTESECPSCKAAVPPGAKFCHNCGAPTGDKAVGKQWNWKAISLVGVGVIVVVLGLAFMLGEFSAEKKEVWNPPQSGVTGSSAPPGQPVDLSSMTPREAADRLFNRVMAAAERGDTEEAKRFAPMALTAYGLVDRLDADAHYHVGLIYLSFGDFNGARKQIENLNREAPDHLLGLVLSFRVAEKVGDRKGASDARARFAATYDSEIKNGRPEYEAHRITIEKFHTTAMTSKTADTSGQRPKRAEPGAQLYATTCGGCHGPNASGSDKGPPLVHRIYEPSHHANASFYRAVRQGVRSHHWSFGDMPPLPSVTDDQIKQIVGYVRALQVKSGIK